MDINKNNELKRLNTEKHEFNTSPIKTDNQNKTSNSFFLSKNSSQPKLMMNKFFFNKAKLKNPISIETNVVTRQTSGTKKNNLDIEIQKELRLNGGYNICGKSQHITKDIFEKRYRKDSNILETERSFFPRGNINLLTNTTNSLHSRRYKTDFSYKENMIYGDNPFKLNKRPIIENMHTNRNCFVPKNRLPETTSAYNLKSSCGRFTTKPHEFKNQFLNTKTCEFRTQKVQKKFDFSNPRSTRYEKNDSILHKQFASMTSLKAPTTPQNVFYENQIKKRQKSTISKIKDFMIRKNFALENVKNLNQIGKSRQYLRTENSIKPIHVT